MTNAAHRILFTMMLCVAANTGCSAAPAEEDNGEGELANEEGALTSVLAVGTQAVTTARLRLRTGPSLNNDTIRVLPMNATVTIMSAPQNSFYKVKTSSGDTGYCHGNYLEDSGGTTNGNGNGNGNGGTLSGSFPTSGDIFTARGTGYYPDSSALEGGFVDRKGVRLRTLQAYLNGSAEYVSVAMDTRAFSYGQKLRIKQLEQKYNRVIEFRVVDTGGAFQGRGRSRIDICTANNSAA
ncbi:MAG TPA: SH3 domain-containing protein, partial [Acidimicrobiia bacterium]|nr:SH3 domain-containing protein [Acidimicrobiia bacterium]